MDNSLGGAACAIFGVVASLLVMCPACGGKTDGSAPGGEGSGGAGGAAPIDPCPSPFVFETACDSPSMKCVGPCSASWQAVNVCTDGKWAFEDVVACGPDAQQCASAFSGSQPCCGEPMDCTGKPDGYPGFGCTPGDGSYCACICQSGRQVCAC